jgi:hypothetical protein
MKRLSHIDGTWGDLLTQWSRQCHDLQEDFEGYLPETMKLLGSLVEQTEQQRWDGVFAYEEDHQIEGICFVNGAFIPGYSGRVLRVRHIILSPKNDFGEYDEEHFARVLGAIFERVLQLSEGSIPCQHLKFHFRSPADVALFRKFSSILPEGDRFSSVQMKGAWLMLTRC